MARRKITDAPEQPEADELPDLTEKERRFVTALLSGKSGADSIRAATDTSAWSQNAIWVEAAKLRARPSVRLWLSAARQANMGAATVSLAEHIREMERIREMALEAGNIGAAVQAEEKRGKAMGLYVERHEDVTQHDLEHTLHNIAQVHPELARALALQHGIPWQEPASEVRH